MPITLPPLSRRRFLATSLAAGTSFVAGRAWADEAAPRDPHRLALVSDSHVSANKEDKSNDVVMYDNFLAVREQIRAIRARPAAVLHHGDCAYLNGKPEDYAVFVDLLSPLRSDGFPIHMAMGNHDHRENFWKAVPENDPAPRPVENKHVSVIEMPRANWFLLDSLDVVGKTPGAIGEAQLAWLAKALDARATKPAVVMGHHNPDMFEKIGGIADTTALFEVLAPRKQVKAYIYGHTHAWGITERDGIHLVNLPPTAYVFAKGRPNGWVDLQLLEAGARLELKCLDLTHAQHGQQVELKWRT